MKQGVLGINGLGRIAKLSIWQHVGRKSFSEIVVNIGRQVGSSLEDVARFIEKDSTYGTLHNYLYGYRAKRAVENLDEKSGSMTIDDTKVTILREVRNPKDIPWKSFDAQVVIESTGQFTDPTLPPDAKGGALRGHLAAGARKVVVSAPFKIKDKTASMPEDAVTTVLGINDGDYAPSKHRVVSNASCTTNCLAHMIKPLLDYFGVQRILTASMATVHAVTGSQLVLDRAPKAGASDLRRNRSVFNNIILTTTGAAKALGLVIPEMKRIGFIAESVRVPTNTGSLIILVIDVQDDPDPINRKQVNKIYQDATAREKRGYIQYSNEQNVSCDIIGHPLAAAIIEGKETHTRTASISFDLKRLSGYSDKVGSCLGTSVIDIPVTKIVVYGWYDNEMGGYSHMLSDRTISVASTLG
jgi:glyceraldehyde 3-phosphate dehydrogenase